LTTTTPLDGLTVVDLTRVLSGPYCTMLLADMGARVIKVEQPGKGDDTRGWGPPFINGESSYFLSINRNKESVTLDFKHPEGRQLLDGLISRADVVVENFRPGALERLGLDYPALAERHPRLVYCSISGFGHTGPRRKEAGYDAVMQAEGGLMSITGSADGPPYRLGVAIADIVSGMFAAQGITAALFSRERSGRGQQVDVAMLDSVVALLTYQAGIYFANDEAPPRLGNRHPTIVPYETFRASDGDFVVAVGNDAQWCRFCSVTGFPADGRFATNRQRVTNYDALKPALDALLQTQSRTVWIDRLKGAGVPCGSVRDLHEVFSDPQIRARDMLIELEHAAAGLLKMTGTPMKLSETPGSIRTPPPLLGEHTGAVLANDLGIDQERINDLRARGVI
jgi:crotonobetainyl-CoA:carnitine CoA-transferase CaiB-like acyl-CoA transferase